MDNILNKTLAELRQEFKALGLPAFRSRQVYSWLHKKQARDLEEMTDLPKELRQELKKKYAVRCLVTKDTARARDGTTKYLFELADGSLIESVLLKDETGRQTVCLSTQAGCGQGCLFCATGSLGFKRDLTPAEIVSQVYLISREAQDISNIVYMGMGEPFLNYDNVIKSLRLLTDKQGANFGQRKLTVSTCGIPKGIRRLAEEGLQVRLAVSLNSANDTVRSRLMPINRRHSLACLRQALVYYLKKTGRRATLEYIMLDQVNDRPEDLKDLKKFCAGLDVNVNIIPFNPFGKKFRPSKPAAIRHFRNGLATARVNAVVRKSKGTDILAACGQLAGGKR
ncbi:23S rRNA (adenine(2503)-C(2))-methyltransferase RlmN [Candidatus Margulisiibacteriota bacterium]